MCNLLHSGNMKRLSVSLDDNSTTLIEKYEKKYKTSKADVVRKALFHLDAMEEYTKNVSLETIKTYVDHLAKMEHVILDIAHWESIWKEISNGSEEFWNEVYEIGKALRPEYHDRGIREVKDILEYVENTNWYKLNIDSSNSFTLILAVSGSMRFIKTFFEGFFVEYPRKVEITNGHKKLRIVML